MRPCKDCKKAHEMVLASMEYVKVLGFRIRKTEEISETWKKAAQTHAEDCVKLDEQLHHLRTAAESGMLPQIVKERDALRAECDDHWQREGIEKQRRIDVEAQLSDTLADIGALFGVAGSVRSITAAIEKLKERNVELAAERERMKAELAVVKDERDTLRKERDGLMIQVQDMRAEIDRLKKPARKHPVAVGEYVKRLTGFNTTPAGEIGRVTQVDDDASEIEYEVTRPNGQRGVWCAKNCTPCEPPTAATHDTPAGKETAHAAVTPHPGDVVRLINTPPEWEAEWGQIGDTGTVKSVSECDTGVRIRETGMQWPGDCIEIVQSKRTPTKIVSDEATHDTPDGKQAAESAVTREPKPGDVVRLVRIPTPGPDFDGFIDFPWNTDWGVVGDVATVVATLVPPNLPVVAVRVSSGLVVWWPLSCVEIVEDAK